MRRLILLVLSAFVLTQANAAPVPDFDLVDQDGKAFKLHDLKGRYVLVSFVFTRCPMPELCPLNMKLSSQLINKWNALPWSSRSRVPLTVLAVTIDPEYDTPERLRTQMEGYSLDKTRFKFATGEPQKITDFAAEFNVIAFPSGETISHSMKTILLSPQMEEIAQYKDNDWTPEKVLADMKPIGFPAYIWILVPLIGILGMLVGRASRRRRLVSK